MANYQLDISFTEKQLSVLHLTGSNIIVAKPSKGGSPNVAWQVFRPLAANSLNWTEEYGIYAANTQFQNGARLLQASSTDIPAETHQLYTLKADGTISSPAEGGSEDSFSLKNEFQTERGYMTIGLFQNAKVNGTDVVGNAISAAPVMHMSTAKMTPFTTVYIWIQSQIKSNSVITSVTSPMTQLTFGAGVDKSSVRYNSDSGRFVPTDSGHSLNTVTDIMPSL